MLYQTGSIPKEGETIVWDNYSFEIVDMDGHRIDKILITPKEPEIKDSLP